MITRRNPLWCCGVPAVAFLLLTITACTTSQPKPDDPAPAQTSRQTAQPTYGDDPIGTARQWAASPPETTDETLRQTLQNWSDPALLRIYRTSPDTYRGVVAESDRRDAPAILLTITRKNDSWQVTDATRTDATHAWPTN